MTRSGVAVRPLSYEQCVLKAFENDAFNITAKESDGRCILKDASATLTLPSVRALDTPVPLFCEARNFVVRDCGGWWVPRI